jgi:hypothetical protein
MCSHFLVVVTAKERIKSHLFGALGNGKKLRIAGALLGLGENTKLHAPNLTGVHPILVCNA